MHVAGVGIPMNYCIIYMTMTTPFFLNTSLTWYKIWFYLHDFHHKESLQCIFKKKNQNICNKTLFIYKNKK